ncbi:SpoIIE family protein phosphatase [Viridibacillus sp. YIM B01967]|uniref:SpoIIE family protein phosphatase n=1 Tax=Viridibacillus soli TaxID=2798301 RepID=A0ABS1HCC0_9BACL|nr:SpoIIE family protein phosphatase [Viridibacillus soli]MBK3496904.1 SpoIIE family protein phosphatase [Viridibacillus soli]
MKMWHEGIAQNQAIKNTWASVAKRKYRIWLTILFLFCSFYLSKAVLFEATVPFFLPIAAIAFTRYPRWMSWALLGGLFGSLTLGLGQTAIHILELLFLLFLLKTPLKRWPLPIMVGFSILTVQTVWQYIAHSGHPPTLVWLYIGYEGALSIFMTLFLSLLFLPMHQLMTAKWSFERLGAALIVGAMILTAMDGVILSFLSIPRIAMHLLVLVSALVGGVTLATAVAVLTGMILSLSQLSFSGMMAVYAVTGLFAGVCKNIGRLWIAIGGIMASVFFALYDATLPLDYTFFMSIAFATLLFFIFPQKWVVYWQNQLYPNRDEVLLERQKWLTERLTTKLVDFHHFVDFMKELVHDRFGAMNRPVSEEVQERPLALCQSCFKYDKCWGNRKSEMPDLMQKWLDASATANAATRLQLDEKIRYKCVKPGAFLSALEEKVSKKQLSGQFYHGRKMIALQLRDMCQHIDMVMNDMTGEAVSFQHKEDELSDELKLAGIEHFQVDILSNEAGNRKIVCCLPEKKALWETDQTLAERLVLPILQSVFNEPFEIGRTAMKESPYPHLQMTFQSSVRFHMSYDVYTSSKQNTIYSGDSHAVFPLHQGLTAVMLSDGMGHSKKAHQESRRLIRLMRECMHHQMAPETAMHTLHYVMSLKNDSDMYATMDFALVDLQVGTLWSWKAGSMATYLVRGEKCIRLESKSEPVGFLTSFSVEADQVSLKAGDIIFMCTDGLFFEEQPWEEQEERLIRHLRELENSPTEEMCASILRAFRGPDVPNDDCTLVAIRIEHKISNWSLFKPSSAAISEQKMLK